MFGITFAVLFAAGSVGELTVTVDKPDHLYSCNEEIVFTAKRTIHNAVLSGHDDGAFRGDRQGRIRDHLKGNQGGRGK